MKQTFEIGRRKRSIAKATAVDGNGSVKINGIPAELMEPEMLRLMIMEPIIIGKEVAEKMNINVTVNGGGQVAQAEAARQAIALSLTKKSKKLEKIFNDYDRNMLVSDSRRTEPHKPGPSKPRAHKQRSKR